MTLYLWIIIFLISTSISLKLEIKDTNETLNLPSPNLLQYYDQYLFIPQYNLTPIILPFSLCQEIVSTNLSSNIRIAAITDDQGCAVNIKIENAIRLNYGALIIMNKLYPVVQAGQDALTINYLIDSQFLNITLIAVEIGTSDWNTLLDKINNYNCTITSDGYDFNPWIYYIKGYYVIVIRILLCIFYSAFIGYEVFTMKNILQFFKSSKTIQLIVIFTSIITHISTIAYFVIDPFHSTGLLISFVIYDLLFAHPVPLMMINTTLISIIWHQMMIKDFHMTKEDWKNRILLIFSLLSAIIYPLFMIAVYIYTSFLFILSLLIIILFLIIIFGAILGFYIYNLVRVVKRIEHGDFAVEVKNRHLDKFSVILVYFLILVTIAIAANLCTVAANLIAYTLLLLLINVNSLLFVYFVRVTKSKGYSSKPKSTSNRITSD